LRGSVSTRDFVIIIDLQELANPCAITDFERLPTFLGWTPRKEETNLTTLMAVAKRVMAATPDMVVPPDNFFFLGH
jgi:hypothetical protein